MSVALPLLVDPAFVAEPVSHAFTTREGGVATGPVASLTLARSPDVEDAALVENWARVARALSVSASSVVLMDQVHGDRVLTVSEGTGPLATAGAADAVVTTTPGLLLTVRVADCLPVLLAGPGVVGVAHAGWRGAAAGIAVRTAKAMCELAGCQLSDLRASLGPCIAAASYETGPEVPQALVSSGVPRHVASPSGEWVTEHADVRASVAYQLAAVGVGVSHVVADTATDARLFSYRRDAGRTGRQVGAIALRA